MKIGIVGLPNVGKSTLFNSITKAGAECANYPFCTIEPNVGVVAVPDERIEILTKMYNPEKVTYAITEFVDIAGLVKGASKGEGLGNKFLSHIREVDAIVHVVRCFENANVVHVDGSIDSKRDIETINLELIFSDLEAVEKRLDRATKLAKGDKKYQLEIDALNKIKEQLNNGQKANLSFVSDDQKELLRDLYLLSSKPVIYVANISEEQLANVDNDVNVNNLKQIAKEENAQVIPLCIRLEEDLAGLDDEDKKEMLKEFGMNESGLDKLIKSSYELLGLISYLTAGEPEVRAWTIKKGTKAPQAAGKIHTDFEKGFIRAEIVSFDDLVSCGSIAKAKEKGLVRLEGKEYVMQDGDVTLFRFNV